MQLLVIFCVIVVFVECVVCVPVLIAGKKDATHAHECGVEASHNLIHHNPWLVYMEYYRRRLTGVRCAATLIGSRHAVTAAHCAKNSLYTRLVARLGEYDITTDSDSDNGIVADPVVRINISEVIVHENYTGGADDIAILVLEKDAPYTDFIRPICLPTGEVTRSDIFSAAGWGEVTYMHKYSPIKKIIPLPFWSRQDCQKVYKNLDLPERVICAGGERGLDTCRGDSGGPLTLIKEKTELWGVTSSGNVRCGTEGSPGIYTNVKEHLEWINDVVRRTS